MKHLRKELLPKKTPAPFDVIINHGQTQHLLSERHSCSLCCKSENEFNGNFSIGNAKAFSARSNTVTR